MRGPPETAAIAENAVLVVPILIVQRRNPRVRIAWTVLPQDRQFARLVEGKRSQEGRIDKAEDRGIGADSQGQHDDPHRRESRGTGEEACAIPNVLNEGWHGG